jgi:hypothetical protein
VAAAEAEKQALKATILSVFKEERPTVCFLCLGRMLPVFRPKPHCCCKRAPPFNWQSPSFQIRRLLFLTLNTSTHFTRNLAELLSPVIAPSTLLSVCFSFRFSPHTEPNRLSCSPKWSGIHHEAVNLLKAHLLIHCLPRRRRHHKTLCTYLIRFFQSHIH